MAISLSASASIIMALPAIYRSTTTLLLGQDAITGSLVTTGSSDPLDQRLHVIRQELLSREQLLELIARFDLYSAMREGYPTEAVLVRMRRDVLITQSTTSQVSQQRGQQAPMEVRISYQGWTASQAADVANAMADIYREKFESFRFGQSTRTTEFLRDQLEEVENRLHMQENEINAYRAENLGQLPEQVNLNLATLERLNTDLRLNGERQVQLLARRNATQATVFGTVVATNGEPRLELLRREMTAMRARFNDSHPGMIRILDEIRLLEEAERRSSMANGEESAAARTATPTLTTGQDIPADGEMQRLRDEETNLRGAISAVLRRLQLTPEIDQTLNQMTQTYNTVREEHLTLQRRFQDARLAQSLESRQTQQFKVLEPALPPDFSAGPNRIRLLLMAVILTLVAVGAALFFLAQIDHTFRSPSALSHFSSIPVLASVPHLYTTGERWQRVLSTLMLLITICAATVVTAWLAYDAGSTAKGIVWIVTGNNA